MAIPFAGFKPVPLNGWVEQSFECLEIAFAPGREPLLGECKRLTAHAREGHAPRSTATYRMRTVVSTGLRGRGSAQLRQRPRPSGRTYLYVRRMYEVMVDRARAHAAEEPGAGDPAPHELACRGLRIMGQSSSAGCGIGRSRSSRFPTATRGSS